MPVLEVSGLRWTVGGAEIVRGVDLAVAEGELLAVIGPNGAGKTSLFNLVSGLVRPTAGRIAVDGADVTGEPPHSRAARGVGRTFQSSSVFPSMTVAEHVALAARAAAPRSRRRSAGSDTAVTGVLDQVGLAGRTGAYAIDLSHGDKRKLELALLLAAEPRLMLLDEPMAGVASEEVPGLVEVIRSLHAAGRTVCMVEHHMDVVLGLADRVAVMHHGALLACGSPAEVMADPVVQQAYLGEAL